MYFYNYVSVGGIASINYAYFLIQFSTSIVTFALSTAIFPKISEAFVQKSFVRINEIFKKSFRINIIIYIPITFLLFFFGDSILKLLYERGNFTHEGTMMTFGVLKIFALGLIFYSNYTIIYKLFYSSGMTFILLIIAISGILLKVIFSFVLVAPLSQDGLVLGTTISFVSIFIMGIIFLIRRFKFSGSVSLINELIINLSNGFFSLLLTILISGNLFLNQIHFNVFSIILFTLIYYLNLYYCEEEMKKIVKNLIIKFYQEKIT